MLSNEKEIREIEDKMSEDWRDGYEMGLLAGAAGLILCAFCIKIGRVYVKKTI